MATLTVKQSGGDYSTLNAAIVASTGGDTISIEGSWTVNDTTACVIPTGENFTDIVIGDSLSAHPGYWDTSQNHYRLVVSGSHAITVSANACTIDGLAIKQNGSGNSDEGIRINNSQITTIKNCLITCGRNGNDQDGIYFPYTLDPVVVVENCIIWDFTRRGIGFDQTGANSNTAGIKVNSCTIIGNGTSAEGLGAGIGMYTTKTDSTSKMLYVDIHNSIVMNNTYHANSADILVTGGSFRVNPTNYSVNVSYSVDSDGSIGATGVSNNSGNLNNRTLTYSTSPGTGDWVIIEDYSTSPYDFRLVDNAENDAKNAHSTATAEGLTIPAIDIVGTTRPSGTYYDMGAFEIEITSHTLSATGISSSPVVGTPAIGQKHTLSASGVTTGTPVTGTSSIGQTHTFSVNAIEAGNLAVGNPAIGQIHILSSIGVETGDPSVGTALISQTHTLSALGIETESPILGVPGQAQTHALAATGISSGSPDVASSSLGQIHTLQSVASINTQSPTSGNSSIGQTHTLLSDDTVASPIIVGTPQIEVVYEFEVNGIQSGSPQTGSPDVQIIYSFDVNDITVTPFVIYPSVGQKHILETSSIEFGNPTISPTSIAQIHLLSSVAIGIDSINISVPTIGQTHVLETSDLTTSPFVESPLLVQGFWLTGEGITTDGPVVGSSTIGQTHSLDASDISAQPITGSGDCGTIYSFDVNGLDASPTVGTTSIGEVHVLYTSDIVLQPIVGVSSLTHIHALLSSSITITPVVALPEVHELYILYANGVGATPTTNNTTLRQIHSFDPIGVNLPYIIIGSPDNGRILTDVYTAWSAESIGAYITAIEYYSEKTYYKPIIIFNKEE